MTGRLICLATLLCVASVGVSAAPDEAFVRVSPRDPRYLELSDGRPYIPIGLNLISPGVADGTAGLARMAEWMQQLGANGGNYIRVWVSSPFWDIEHEKSGVYDEAKAARIDEMLQLARRHGIRVKLTIEHFREMSAQPRQPWANQPLHLSANGGPATSMADFFSGPRSREQFQRKLAWLARRYGDNPTIFGWELWNEVNAVTTGPENFLPWTETMLAELHRLFPRNLAMQSLGSFDSARVRELYRRHSLLPGNDVAQVHRYLDLGASLEICHEPVDVLTADSVRELLAFEVTKPVLQAESGAVEPRHSGPFKLYAKDTAGIILHDVLFAPFFAGAAGAGQIWHWDQYVARNHLWHHFARFAATVKGIDPGAEHFEVAQIPHSRLRIYALRGRQTWLVWCRDSQNTWQTELEHGRPPEQLRQLTLDLGEMWRGPPPAHAQAYDPWTDRWTELKTGPGGIELPSFSRSIVLRIDAATPSRPPKD